MTLLRRVLLVLLALGCMCGPALGAGATTEDDLAAARQKLDDARKQGDELAAASTHPSNQLAEILDSSNAVNAIRRTQPLDQANQTDHDVVKKQAAVQRQAETSQLVGALQARLDTQIAIGAFAAANRKAELEAERAALVAQQALVTSQASPFSCPVPGASYSDDYGSPSGHPGIDMFVPIGTEAMAVRAGTVTFAPNEGAGGNAAYLNADDGNTYYYAHFSGYVGGPRAVAKGEVIGLTGMTGNATAPHLHFEIRLGGPNGNRTDPYPTLKAAGC